MIKQRMLQKTKILKTWRFVRNNIHPQKWRLKRLQGVPEVRSSTL